MKNRSYIFLLVALILFLILGYVLFYDNKPKKELFLTFLLKAPIAKHGDDFPPVFEPFTKIFESNPKEIYYPKLYIKRLDRHGEPKEEMGVTKQINLNIGYNKVKKGLINYISSHNPIPPLSYLSREDNLVDYKDTIGYLTFILTNKGNPKVDNNKYFDDTKRLVKHIDMLLEDDFFENNKKYKRDAIKIIIPDGLGIGQNYEEPGKNIDKKPGETGGSSIPEEYPVSTDSNNSATSTDSGSKVNTETEIQQPKRIYIDLKLNEYTNKLTWNNKLKDITDKISINLTLVKKSGRVNYATYNVTGKSMFLFDPNKHDFSGNYVDIELITNTSDNNFKIYGTNKLKNKELKCAAN